MIKFRLTLITLAISISTFGQLTYNKTYGNPDSCPTCLNQALELLLSNDGKFLYVFNSTSYPIVLYYKRQDDGDIQFLGKYVEYDLGYYPSVNKVIMSPDDQYIFQFVGNSDFGIKILERDKENGTLVLNKLYLQEDIGLELSMVTDAKFSSDGNYLYVSTSQHLLVFSVGTGGNNLSLVQQIEVDDEGTTSYSGLWSMAISKDNKNVYTFSESVFCMESLTTWQRDQTTGKLTYLEKFTTADLGFESNGRDFLLESPDDKNLYAIGPQVYTFSRNLSNGKLEFEKLQDYEEDLNVYFRVDRAYTANISPDGLNIIIPLKEYSALLTLYRDTTDGILFKKQILKNDNLIYPAIHNWPRLIISNDSKDAYLINAQDKKLMSYKLQAPVGLNPHIDACEGDTVELFVDSGYEASWSTGDTLSSIQIAESNSISVHVKDNIGREGWDTTSVEFHILPYNVFIWDTLRYSNIEQVRLCASVPFGWPYCEYLWNDTLESECIAIDTSLWNNNSVKYKVELTDSYGCTSTDFITSPNWNSLIINEKEVVNVFPIPFSNNLNINLSGLENSWVNIKVYNQNGEIKKNANIKGGSIFNLSTTDLIEGLYILRIAQNNQHFAIKILKY